MFGAVFILVLLLYVGLNVWIGWRAWQGLFQFIPHASGYRILYWIMLLVISTAYLWGRLLKPYLSWDINRVITFIGSYWIGIFFYTVLLLLLFEILRGAEHFLRLIPDSVKSNPRFPLAIGLTILVSLGGIMVYGAWSAANPVVHRYDLQIAKKAGPIKELRIVMASDIHLDTIHDNDSLLKLVERINELNPDVILFPGDVVDESVQLLTEQKMAETFRLLKSKYGSFASLGNHEYISGHPDDAVKYLGEGGVRVLKDEALLIDNSFYIIGRDDLAGSRFSGGQRKPLSAITGTLDKKLPLILMDHQPSQIQEAVTEEVDLQLSGHTHKGQMWPNHLITQRMYPTDWGLLQRGPFNLLVSNGYGTWGPPIRTGNRPEILDIHLHFTD